MRAGLRSTGAMQATLRTSLAVLLLSLVSGCATQPGARSDARDPWEGMNRATYRFNDKFDKGVARPVARGYRKVTPHLVQTGIRNVFDNVDTTIVMINDLLQWQPKAFVSDTARLIVNTLMGLGGLFDVATRAGLEKNDRDFGQTLGKWSVRPGPYLVLPFLGPSDVRDTFGRTADAFSTPRTYLSNPYWEYGSWLLDKVDLRSRYLDYDRVIDGAYDPYAFLRNAYLQNREFKVHGSNSRSEEEDEQKMLEESGIEPAPPASTAPAPAPAPPPPPPH
jgi:phospholipid-binding lipoprotein MlaA